jgi:hypothetical protein
MSRFIVREKRAPPNPVVERKQGCAYDCYYLRLVPGTGVPGTSYYPLQYSYGTTSRSSQLNTVRQYSASFDRVQ